MTDREDFLEWFRTTWLDAERALHEGDAEPRSRTWSEREPVSLFGAWLTATDATGVREAFRAIARSFSDADIRVDLVAADLSGDLAYTVHRETTAATVDGEHRRYSLRVTQVYRREEGRWRVVHRHGDEEWRETL